MIEAIYNIGMHIGIIVLWSHETKLELCGHVNFRYVCMKVNEAHKTKRTLNTIKHAGGSVMLWGCYAASGQGELARVQDIMDKKLSILKHDKAHESCR